MLQLSWVAAAMACSVFISPSAGSAASSPSLPVVTPVVAVMANSSSEKILQQSNEQFSARMNRIILKSRPEKSAVWSAFSLLSPLANLAMGSVEETHDEILKTIGFPNDNVTMDVFTDVNRRLRSVEEIEFNVSNGIYVKKGQTLNEEFVAMSKNTFGTDIKNVDFSKNVETAAEINSWVANNTDHRINDLINPDTLLENETAILLNAVSFKVLELPYVDSKGSVIVLLPDDILNAESLLSAFNAPLNYTILKLESYEVDISLPRFRIETTTNLIEVFTEMGCKRFITPNEAQLDNLLKGNGNLYISEAIQKAVIEVDEQGDETYDANDFGTKSQSAVLPQKIIFNADHPFLFFVKKDDNILLSGVFQPYSDDD